MTGPVFVDTNVLVYSRDLAAGEKQKRAAAWMRSLWKCRMGRLSTQVLGEFYAVVTRKLEPGLDRADAREEIRELVHWQPVPITAELIEMAWEIEEAHGLSWWDSLIAAAARASGCRYLLSEDFQDGLDLDGILVVDPFAHEPGSLDP